MKNSIDEVLKKTPPNIDLNVNSLFNSTLPLSEFLELLKTIKPE